jgi:hypothetical protein
MGVLVFLVVAVVVAVASIRKAKQITANAAALASDTFGGWVSSAYSSITGLFGLSATETETIERVAAEYGVDPSFLASLRKTENGRRGREFGVLAPAAMIEDERSLERQAQWAAGTIIKTVARYESATGQQALDPYSGRYTAAFIRYFSGGGPGYAGYAPLNAANDPSGLNANHLRNLLSYYGQTGPITAA